jgi:hypothetical protein
MLPSWMIPKTRCAHVQWYPHFLTSAILWTYREPAISLQSQHVSLVQWTNPLLPVTRDLGSKPLGVYLCETEFLLLALSRYKHSNQLRKCGLEVGDFCGKICSCRAAFLSKDANLKLGTAEIIAIADMSRYAVAQRIFVKVAHMQLRNCMVPASGGDAITDVRKCLRDHLCAHVFTAMLTFSPLCSRAHLCAHVLTSVPTCSPLCSRAHPILGGIWLTEKDKWITPEVQRTNYHL